LKKEIMSNSSVNTGTSQPSVSGSIPPKVWLYIIGIPLVIGGGYFGVVRPILRKIGALQSPEDKAFDKVNDLVEKQPFWSRSYYLTINNGVKPLTETQSTFYANELYDGMKGGTWYNLGTGLGTDENKLYGVFRNIGSKAGISQVAEKYYNTRQKDLLSELKDELSPEYMGTISQIISTYA
jgi:hypothetical protein